MTTRSVHTAVDWPRKGTRQGRAPAGLWSWPCDARNCLGIVASRFPGLSVTRCMFRAVRAWIWTCQFGLCSTAAARRRRRRGVKGAPPSLRNIKCIKMRHVKQKNLKSFHPRGAPRECFPRPRCGSRRAWLRPPTHPPAHLLPASRDTSRVTEIIHYRTTSKCCNTVSCRHISQPQSVGIILTAIMTMTCCPALWVYRLRTACSYWRQSTAARWHHLADRLIICQLPVSSNHPVCQHHFMI